MTSAKTSQVRKVAIVAANRIPFSRSDKDYAHASNQDMLTAAMGGLVDRAGLAGEIIGEVAAGAVLKHSRDFNLARESVLGTKLDPHTPAYDVQQACATGMEGALGIANKIAMGQIDSGIVAGVDTASDAPIAFGDGMRKKVLAARREKSAVGRAKALAGMRFRDVVPEVPVNSEPRTGLSMGNHQALTTIEWGVTREAQDELALASHQNLVRAYDEGFFDDLMTPYLGLERDNNLREGLTLDKLAGLRTVFGKGESATMTAGNSTPLTDGASSVLFASEEWCEAHGLEPMAYFTTAQVAAVDFVHGKEGLLMAPAYAMPKMLERTGHDFESFDFYEIHEAFASQVLSTLKAWEDPIFCQERLGLSTPLGKVDRSKLNVNGSSLACGHPFAATGGRIIATAAKLLQQKGSGKAVLSVCAAGGQGITAIIER